MPLVGSMKRGALRCWTSMPDYVIRFAHLYPDVMNIYGDRGNVIALRYRCERRGIGFEVTNVNVRNWIRGRERQRRRSVRAGRV
jgi:hypothetical protein